MSDLEAKAREIVETWSDFKGGSFSGSDLWDLSEKISAALREERERCAKIVDHLSRIFETPYTDPLPENNTPEAGMRMAADFAKIAAATIRGDDNG